MTPKQIANENLANTIIKNMEKRRMEGYYCHTKEEAVQKVLELIPEEKRDAVIEMLAQDPRPGYQRDSDRIYGMKYGDMNLRFRGEEDRIVVIEVQSVRD